METSIRQVREYWDKGPCNIRHSRRPLGTREYFDEVEARKYFVEPHVPGFAQFNRWKEKKVLEIGCGIGTDSLNFARAGANLTVVDVSPKSVAIARKRFGVYGLNASFHCGNAEELSTFLPAEPFDLIYSFGVIHHTPHPEKVFSQMEKYCKPSTEIRVMLYSKWSWKVLWIILKHGHGAFWEADELVRTFSEAQTSCPVTHYYSFKDIRKLFSNFQIVEMRKEHIFPYVVSQYINYDYRWAWPFRWMPRPVFGWLEHQFGWHTLVVARPKAMPDLPVAKI